MPTLPNQPTAVQVVDLAIHNALILTMNSNHDIVQGGTVLVKDGIIVAVLPKGHDQKYHAEQIIIAKDGDIVMPGMINGHTHVPMSLFRGLGDDAANIIFDVMFPLEKQFVTAENVYLGAKLSIAEMLLGGVTTFADMYYFEEQIAKASVELGIRAVLGETIMQYPTPDSAEPYGGIARAIAFIEKYKKHPLITPAFAPHAPYTVAAEYLQKIHELAKEHNVPLLMHLAEMLDEKTGDLSSVGYMQKLGILNSRWVFAHCIHVNDEDIQNLQSSSAGVVHNPASNMKGGFKVAPAREMFNANVNLGLGTDGAMTGGTQDLLSHFSLVARAQKLRAADMTVMRARDVITMATLGGAKALGMQQWIGSIEVGKKADITIVRPGISSQPNYDPYSTLVYTCNQQNVRHVIVDGKVVVYEHRLVNANLAAIIAEVGKVAAVIKQWYIDHIKDPNFTPSLRDQHACCPLPHQSKEAPNVDHSSSQQHAYFGQTQVLQFSAACKRLAKQHPVAIATASACVGYLIGEYINSASATEHTSYLRLNKYG